MTTLEDVYTKIGRAKKHFAELKSEIVAFRRRNPYGTDREVDPQTNKEVHRFRLREPIPRELGAIVGDCTHNLRSSLDLLANALVILNGGVPTNDTHFPIRSSPSQLAGDAPHILRGASVAAIEVVKKLQEHKHGRNPFVGLHLLDIADKHRLLVPVVMSNYGARFTPNFGKLFGERWANIKMPSIDINAAKPDILRDGDIVSVETFDPDKDDSKLEQLFGESFGDVEPFAGKPVIPTLQRLIDLVEDAIKVFESEIFKP